MPDNPDRPVTVAELDRVLNTALEAVVRRLIERQDRAVESVVQEMSRRFEETAFQFRSIHQSLELLNSAVSAIDQRTSLLTRVLVQRGEDAAADRAGVLRMRADLDAAIARITALEQRQNG